MYLQSFCMPEFNADPKHCFSPEFWVLFFYLKVGMHRISSRPDIRPDNPAFFDIRYPAGYQIALLDIRPDIR
jgi:hypothetical protein